MIYWSKLAGCPDGYIAAVGHNFDILGNIGDKKKDNVRTAENCGDLCIQNQGCNSFMWSNDMKNNYIVL